MFVDKVKINARGGNGGSGCVSFRREMFVPKGGPNGGNGGAGGSIYLVATAGVSNLVDLKYCPLVKAKTGGGGMGSDRHGAAGEDVLVAIPVGTVVRDIERDYELIADLCEDGQKFLLCKGGRGGYGNRHFQSNRNKLPRNAEPGTEGEERNLELELKTLADVGLIGMPNAGKSTLISAITDAHPKVAPYPFTTLHPVVGVIEFEDFMRITVADIPGLIEGAHDNVGLGHHFLRHVERTRVLAYVLDMAGTDNRDPLEDLATLKEELECYRTGITDCTSVVIANKIDEPASAENLERLKEAVDYPIFPVCAVTGEFVLELTSYLHDVFKKGGLHQACPTTVESNVVVAELPEDDAEFWEF